MRHCRAILVAILVAILALPGLSAAAEPVEARDVNVTIAAPGIHEECQRVEAGQKRRYHWKASAPVDFNIHYHHGDEVFYPVKRERNFDARSLCVTAARDRQRRVRAVELAEPCPRVRDAESRRAPLLPVRG